MGPLLREDLVPQHGALVLLALDLLAQVKPSDLSPSDVSQDMIKLFVLLLPHHVWLEPYIGILDPAALTVTRASKNLLEKARPAASLLDFGRR